MRPKRPGRADGCRFCSRASSPADSRPGATVTITDSGPGVSEGNQAKLFQPFFTTKGEQGTGLGLWVSQGIVEKHGGR
jgi:signal transduction histidine kinase